MTFVFLVGVVEASRHVGEFLFDFVNVGDVEDEVVLLGADALEAESLGSSQGGGLGCLVLDEGESDGCAGLAVSYLSHLLLLLLS